MNTEDKKFEWTDELVFEFVNFYDDKCKKKPTWTSEAVEDFKKSKQPYKGIGFEILCFTDCNYHNYWRQHDGTYTSQPLDKGLPVSHFLSSPNTYKIFRVRRLEDKEIFSIGDKIGWGKVDSYEATLDSFRIKDGRLKMGYSQDRKFADFYFVDFEKAVNLHKKKSIQKPPLGLRPRYILDSDRLKEINEAMLRYIEVGYPVPDGWLKERNQLIELTKNKD